MRVVLAGLALFAPLAFATPALAQEGGDPTASAAIMQGDFASAERTLIQELRIHPNRPELLLNLAAVYAQTGRQSEARILYRQVLGQDNVLMDLSADRTVGSHTVAVAGLRRIETVRTASVR